jgi:hypothetical protein
MLLPLLFSQDELCRGRAPQSKEGSPETLEEVMHAGGSAQLPPSTAGAASVGDPYEPCKEEEPDQPISSELVPGLQWALLRFETPVSTPLKGLLIASKLDTDVNTTNCRIAFYGRLVDKVLVRQPAVSHTV